MSIVNVDRLVLAMVSDTFEENAPTQEANLKRLDIDIDAKFVPGIGSDEVGYNRCKQTVHVEDEPQHKDPTC